MLLVDSASLPPLDDPDEWYDHQLVGLAAVDPAGAAAGHGRGRRARARRPTCSSSGPATGREHLVPFVRELVPEVDVPAGRIVVAAPEGLFDL